MENNRINLADYCMLSERFCKWVESSGMKLTELEELTGISAKTLHAIVCKKCRVSQKVLKQLQAADEKAYKEITAVNKREHPALITEPYKARKDKTHFELMARIEAIEKKINELRGEDAGEDEDHLLNRLHNCSDAETMYFVLSGCLITGTGAFNGFTVEWFVRDCTLLLKVYTNPIAKYIIGYTSTSYEVMQFPSRGKKGYKTLNSSEIDRLCRVLIIQA